MGQNLISWYLATDPNRKMRRAYGSFKVEGSPIWGIFGFLEWWLLALALTALYVLQVGALGGKRPGTSIIIPMSGQLLWLIALQNNVPILSPLPPAAQWRRPPLSDPYRLLYNGAGPHYLAPAAQYVAPDHWELNGNPIRPSLQLAWVWVAVAFPTIVIMHGLVTTLPG